MKNEFVTQALSTELKSLVHETVALLGELLKAQLSVLEARRIDQLRKRFVRTRGSNPSFVKAALRKSFRELAALSAEQRVNTAKAFTLMLELMNACENAYRSQKILQRPSLTAGDASALRDSSIIYVLTAHPTEARTPAHIWIFEKILEVLTQELLFQKGKLSDLAKIKLTHLLAKAWNSPFVRTRKPTVEDEAHLIYALLLKEESLETLLQFSKNTMPFYVRAWVGGDKDGHPGVDEKVFQASLQLSRTQIFRFFQRRNLDLQTFLASDLGRQLKSAHKDFEISLMRLKRIRSGDGRRVQKLRKALVHLTQVYQRKFQNIHPALQTMQEMLRLFPAMVVTLEFRESSDVLMNMPKREKLAIKSMLETLAGIAKGGDPRWYVRSFIISMTEKIEHLEAAAALVQKTFGAVRLPIVPLFEQLKALQQAPQVVTELLRRPVFKKARRKYWDGKQEMMLGYSDSSKESGVLQSRLAVAETMFALDDLCRSHGVQAVFFQGSGGSVDRGGGSVAEQTAWWSSQALRTYKVTVQGEMVERSLANSAIAQGQLQRIAQSVEKWQKAKFRKRPRSKDLDVFAKKVAQAYRSQINDPRFLKLIESATPYPYLSLLKIGSRPTKRTQVLSVSGLRAIPWIMCWTQSRVLFPTWWGVGHAWENSSSRERAKIKKIFQTHELFRSYIAALGFTLSKVEMPVWDFYLERSPLPTRDRQRFSKDFHHEFARTRRCLRELLQSDRFIPQKPWLEESVRLRSPMIHPLNVLQLLAFEKNEPQLARLTVTGISASMMTTG